MDSANNISRRTLMSGAIAASFTAIPAVSLGAVSKAAPSDDDREDEFRQAWVSLTPSQRHLMRGYMTWVIKDGRPETDPRTNWPERIKENLRAGSLM